jgi:hypothetical protein
MDVASEKYRRKNYYYNTLYSGTRREGRQRGSYAANQFRYSELLKKSK